MGSGGRLLVLLILVVLVGCGRDLREDDLAKLDTPARLSVGDCFVAVYSIPSERWERAIVYRVLEIGARAYRTEYHLFVEGWLPAWYRYGGISTRAFSDRVQRVRCP